MSALIWLPMRSSFWADNGVELLADGNMEQAGVGAWGVWQSAVLTKQGNPHNGTQCLRVAYGGQPSPAASQTVLGAGRKYHAQAWARGDGAVNPYLYDYGFGIIWPGTSSASWQLCDRIYVTASAAVGFFTNTAVAGYTEWDDCSIQEQFMYTANEGSLKGKLQLGDGRTSTTFPTKLPNSRGFSFDGGDSAEWRQPIASGLYTICMLLRRTDTGTARRFYMDARGAGGAAGAGWINTPNLTPGTLAASSGTIYVNGVATTSINYGQPSFVAVAGMTISVADYMVLCGSFVRDERLIGDMWGFGLYPGTLTPTELRDIEYRMRKEANLP